jgi:8-oxo-dGTP diphosphatase
VLNVRGEIRKLVENISPLDQLESKHIEETISWIDSDKEIFRIRKPSTPNKHLVSYFCLYDDKEKKLLLVEHRNARLWLPAGGHVDPGEHPSKTAVRECAEELSIDASFLFDEPIFITSTLTVGLTAGHTDVSLWYVLKGDSRKAMSYDEREFSSIRWFLIDEIPFEKADPHLKRFINKMQFTLLDKFNFDN